MALALLHSPGDRGDGDSRCCQEQVLYQGAGRRALGRLVLAGRKPDSVQGSTWATEFVVTAAPLAHGSQVAFLRMLRRRPN